MLNNRLILRANRATSDLTEYLMNCKFNHELAHVIPTVDIEATIVTNLTTLPLHIKLQEPIERPEHFKSIFYSFEVYQVGQETGELFLLGKGEFNTDTMSTLQSILAAGHLAGDLIKFYFKGAK